MAARLPASGKTLAKGWLKFVHIMRLGKVVREVERAPVQQLEVMFEPDLWKKLETPQHRAFLTSVCTDGAPSCSMRLKTPDDKEVQKTGPYFQMQVVVQVPGKGQMQDSRYVCFAEGLALLEKQLPRESQVVENSGFRAISRRFVKFRDMDALEEARAVAVAKQMVMPDASKPVKATAFRWQGRGTVAAQDETPAVRQPLDPTPAAFKWCKRGSVPLAPTSVPTPLATSTPGRKRGREESEDYLSKPNARDKRMKTIAIAPIRIN
jgi:hypothetical protein